MFGAQQKSSRRSNTVPLFYVDPEPFRVINLFSTNGQQHQIDDQDWSTATNR